MLTMSPGGRRLGAQPPTADPLCTTAQGPENTFPTGWSATLTPRLPRLVHADQPARGFGAGKLGAESGPGKAQQRDHEARPGAGRLRGSPSPRRGHGGWSRDGRRQALSVQTLGLGAPGAHLSVTLGPTGSQWLQGPWPATGGAVRRASRGPSPVWRNIWF